MTCYITYENIAYNVRYICKYYAHVHALWCILLYAVSIYIYIYIRVTLARCVLFTYTNVESSFVESKKKPLYTMRCCVCVEWN